MKDKPLSPELDKIEFLDDAEERMKRAVKAVAAHKPAPQAKPSVVAKRKA